MSKIDREIVFFDLETTGVDTATDRIVEISAVVVDKDLNIIDKRLMKLNPIIAISKEASEVHGITNEDVKDCPTFKDIADKLFEFFKGKDIGGYNIINFDMPMLIEEFSRCKIDFPQEGTNLIDAFNIFRINHKRDLTTAVRIYCNKEMENAHSALHDTIATVEVFQSQFEKHELPGTNAEIQDYCLEGKKVVDITGKIIIEDGEYVYNFGKNKGKKVKDYPDYASWMISGKAAFPECVKGPIRAIIRNKYKVNP